MRFSMFAFAALSSLLVACSGGSSVGSQAPTTAPGTGAPLNYIGSFPLTYTGTTGNCQTTFFPATMNVTSSGPGTDSNGQAITLLAGALSYSDGGSNPFGNVATTGVIVDAPSAFVQKSGTLNNLNVNVFQGQAVTSIFGIFISVASWTPPAATQGDFWENEGSCRVHATITIGAPT